MTAYTREGENIRMQKKYFIARAELYQKEAQTGIEDELQGNTDIAFLILQTLKKSIVAELADLPENDNSYFLFLKDLNNIFTHEDQLFNKLEFIRDRSRTYLQSIEQ